MVDLDKIISSAIKSGKALLGSKQALIASKSGKASVIIMASNCRLKTFHDIKHYSGVSKIPVLVYPSSSSDLGAACGKPFAVSALVIREISEFDAALIRQELTEGDGEKVVL